MNQLGLLLVFLLLFNISCTHPEKNEPHSKSVSQGTQEGLSSDKSATESGNPKRLQYLGREEASLRAKEIHNVSYQLEFSFNENEDQFQGKTVIRFDFKAKQDSTKKTFLELEAGQLKAITLNGKSFSDLSQPTRYDGFRIYFANEELLPKNNQIEITYSHLYNKDGNGLYRFKDPKDQNVYLYTNFEPYDAHQVFPCFDQPDIKATYQVKVEAPSSWEVISNTLPQAPVQNQNSTKTWEFPKSEIFSTYLFALHAGPYSSWKATYNAIPLRLFARKSLAHFVDHQEWLEITKKGLEFFEEYFGKEYPFKKYDQIIVPDFNPGAMENVGAITFNERYVFRTHVTKRQHEGRNNTILHEMAHMWFGDLVTMKWWNGLWLNESFATLMSTLALNHIHPAPHGNSWLEFFSYMKTWAYHEDQLVTTHAIELPVPDTDHAQANFDGITYGKGASALKQLRYYEGEGEFQEGIQRYFEHYSYKNATLADFFKMQSEASGMNLSKWHKQWLQTAGLNTLTVEWSCDLDPNDNTNRISKMNLLQGDVSLGEGISNTPRLRSHKTQIKLFYLEKPKHVKRKKGQRAIQLEDTFNVTYEQAVTPVEAVIGQPCPSIIFPNDQDHDYVKVIFDPTSLKNIFAHFGKLQDPLTRAMVWENLWEMVVDGKLMPEKYADLIIQHGIQEKDPVILASLTRKIGSTSLGYSSVLKYLPLAMREKFQTQFEVSILKHLKAAPKGSDLQLVLYDAFLDIARSPQAMKFAENLLSGHEKLHGITFDQEHRWGLLRFISRLGSPRAGSLIEKESQKDTSDLGKTYAFSAEALFPSEEKKQIWFARFEGTSPEFKNPSPSPSYSSSPLPEVSPSASPSVVATGSPSPAASPLIAASSIEDLTQAQLRKTMRSFFVFGQEQLIGKYSDRYFQYLKNIPNSEIVGKAEYVKSFARFLYPSLCSEEIIRKTEELIQSRPDLPKSIIKTLKENAQEETRCLRARKQNEAS